MQSPNYQRTMIACFIAYMVQAVVNNFVPLFCNISADLRYPDDEDHAADHTEFPDPAGDRPFVSRICGQDRIPRVGYSGTYLYERLGFVQLGVIPGGFRMKDGSYEDICPYYHTL